MGTAKKKNMWTTSRFQRKMIYFHGVCFRIFRMFREGYFPAVAIWTWTTFKPCTGLPIFQTSPALTNPVGYALTNPVWLVVSTPSEKYERQLG